MYGSYSTADGLLVIDYPMIAVELVGRVLRSFEHDLTGYRCIIDYAEGSEDDSN